MLQKRKVSLMLILLMLMQIAAFGLPPNRAVAASAGAAGQGPKVLAPREQWQEVAELRSPNARHFKAGDYMVAEVHATPIHYKDANGHWQPIDTTLGPDGQGGYLANAGHFKMGFTNRAQGNQVKVDLGNGRQVTMGLDEELPDSPAVKGPGAKAGFVPSAAGKKVHYKEKRGLLDYDYEADASGVKETITLRKYTGKYQFELPLSIEGLRIREDGAGGYSLLEPGTGAVRAVIPPPMVVDAAGQGPRYVDQVIRDAGRGTALIVTVDPEWLAAPERRFPVVIDPSVFVAPEGADLMVATIYPGSYGQAGTMNVYKNPYNDERRTLLKFDISSVPQGAMVYQATFDVNRPLYYGSVNVYDVTTEWYPPAATWASPRGQGTSWTPGGDAGTTSYGDLAAGSVSLKSLAQEWVNRTRDNNGIMLRKDTADWNWAYPSAPTLQVIYALDVTAPDKPVVLVTGNSFTAPFPVTVSTADNAGIRRIDLLVDGAIADFKTFPGNSASFTVDPRRFGPGTHTISAYAFDYAGNQAVAAPVSFAAPLPPEPVGLTATPTATGAALAWEAVAGSGAVSYNIYRGTSPVAPLSGWAQVKTGVTGTAFTDTSLTRPYGEQYYYGVTAVNASGVESRVVISRADYVFSPGSLAVTAAGQQNQLAWAASPRDGVTYNIYRGDRPGFPADAAHRIAAGVTGTGFTDGLNAMLNGGFETTGTGADAAYWCCQYYFPNNTVRDTTTSLHGAASYKLWQTYAYQASPYVYADANRTVTGPFTVSAWSKAENVTGAADGNYALMVQVYDQWWSYVTSVTVPFQVGTHGWEQASATFTSPPVYPGGSYRVRVWLYFSGNHAGTAWFDDVQVEPGSAATTFQDSFPLGTAPYYRVSAVDGAAGSSFESTMTAEQVPVTATSGSTSPGSTGVAAPTAVTYQAVGGGLVAASWQPSATPGATYNVYRNNYGYYSPPIYQVASGLTGTTYTDGINHLYNSGFELGSPAGWSLYCGGYCPQTELGGYGGTQSLRINRTYNTWSDQYGFQGYYLYQGTATPITLSGWSRSENVALTNAADYSLTAYFYDSGWNSLGSITAPLRSGTHGWEQAVATFTPARPIYYVYVYVNLKGTATGSAWFDNIQLQDGTVATSWQDGDPVNSSNYYLVRAVKDGVESQNTDWQYLYNRGGVITPTDLAARDLGDNTAELTWTVSPGTRYNVYRATVTNGSIGSYYAVASGLTAGSYRSPVNLVANSSFEVDNNWDYIPDGWSRAGNSDWTYYYNWGTRAARIWRNYTSDSASQVSQEVPLNQTLALPLTASGSVLPTCTYGSTDADFGLRLELFDADGKPVGSGTAPATTGCTNWQRLNVTVSPTAPAKTARLSVVMAGQHTGWAYVDAMQLEPGTQAHDWTENGLTEGASYSYYVVPVDYWGSTGAQSTPITVKASGAPLPVTGLAAQSSADGRVALSWNASITPYTTYTIYRTLGDRARGPGDRIASGLPATTFTDPGNLIANSGFERYQSGNNLPDGWNWTSSAQSGQVVTAGAKFGNAAFQLTRVAPADPAVGVSTDVLLRQATASPVTISGWSKAAAMAGAAGDDYALVLRLEGADGQPVGSATLPYTAAAHDWELKSATLTPTAPAYRAVLQIQLKGGAVGTTTFDGIQLQAGTAATDWVDGPVLPGMTYTYYVSAVSWTGREDAATPSVKATSRSWALSSPLGDLPGLGLDDRWAFADLQVPGGTAYLNLNTGNLVVLTTDSVVPGPKLAQVVRRTYNSLGSRASALGSAGWNLNIFQQLRSDAATGDMILEEGDGGFVRFTNQGNGTYAAPPSVWMSLTPATATTPWKVVRRDGIRYEFDSQLRMKSLTEPNGNKIEYDFSDPAKVTVRGPSTRVSTLTYNDQVRVSKVADAAGRTYTYGYDGAGRLATVTDPFGQVTTYAYDASGRLAEIRDAAGRGVLFTYDLAGRLASYQWKGLTAVSRFAYTANQGLYQTGITDPLGRVSTMTTNKTGNLVEAVDARGNSSRFEYDPWQRLVRTVNPRGLVTDVKYEAGTPTPRVAQVIRHAEEDLITSLQDYNAFDQPGLVIDAAGLRTVTKYDAAGNVLSRTVGDGTQEAATTSYTYKPDGMPTTVVDALNNTTTYEVDGLGQVTAITNALGARTTMMYDAAGNLVYAEDPLHNGTTYRYDALGRRVSVSYPDGGTETFAYDASGLLVQTVQPGGIRQMFTYDPAGRMVAAADAQGNTSKNVYDDAGNLVVTVLPNGVRSRREFDELNRVIRAYDGENLTDAGLPKPGAAFTEQGYDAAGNPVWSKLPNGYKATAEYDLLGRPVKVTQPPATTAYTYDRMGRVLTQRDGNGKWSRYQYDGLGRVTRIYDAANLTATGDLKADAKYTEYSYDKVGRRTAVTDPLGYVTKAEYNALGQVTREIDPLSQVSMNFYDAAGRVTERMDRNANSTNYQYDARGRVTALQYENAKDDVRYTYDSGGRRLSMAGAMGITFYDYDQLGRLTAETSPDGTLKYEYDSAGFRTALVLAEGAMRYTYDRSGRLKTVTDVTGAATSFTYGSSGETAQVSLPNGITQTNTFDAATNRLSSRKYQQTNGQNLTFTYGYDTVGHITSVQKADSWNSYYYYGNTTTTAYEYDDLYRLVASCAGGSYTGYAYDGHGNRVKEETGSCAYNGTIYSKSPYAYTTHEYSPAGWLTRSLYYAYSGATPSTTLYSYDGEGNLLMALGSSQYERYTYDSRNQLTRAQTGTRITYNNYDGDGRRVRRRVVDINTYNGRESTAQSSHYQYDGILVAAERDGANALRMAYSRGPGGRLLTWYKPQQGTTSDNSGVFLVDHLGSVIKMAQGASGYAVNQYDYDAFGKVTSQQEGIANEMKFTGALMDTSGLYHLNARYYNPNIGRFITQDTYRGNPWQPWTQNLYVYTHNNPVNFVDPTGHADVGWFVRPSMVSFSNWFWQQADKVCRTLTDLSCKDMADATTIALTTLPLGSMVVPEMASGTEGSVAAVDGQAVAEAPIPAPELVPVRTVVPDIPGITTPGTYAGTSISASGERVTLAEKQALKPIMDDTGCHSCGTNVAGTKTGLPIGDHQPSTAAIKSGLVPEGTPQVLYPHCATCSAKQGGWWSSFLRKLK